MSLRQIVVRVAIVLTAGAAVSGCLSSDTLIKVKPDGSGTIEQTLLVNPKTFETVAAMAGQMGSGEVLPAEGLPSAGDLLDEEKLKEAAAGMGKGVRYVSSIPLKQGDLEGARAIFAFDDINALTVAQSPQTGRGPADPLAFRLDRRADGSALLTITMPEGSGDTSAGAPADETAGPGQIPPEALAIVKPFLQDLRVALAIDVEGTLVRTNADHVAGSRVTLLDFALGPLLENPEAFQQLGRLGPGATLEQVKPLLKGLPGVKVNTAPAISIEFR